MFQSTPLRANLEEVTPLPNQCIPLKGEVSTRGVMMKAKKFDSDFDSGKDITESLDL
jgi:hypothetical protein